MKRYRINKQKIKRNLLILLYIITIIIVVKVIKTRGIEFLSTIGYFL